MTLSTTPIGGAKQSLIDLRAGAILREKHARTASYRGCPVWLLLTVILTIKTALIILWLAREYESLNVGCVANSFNDTLLLSLKRRRDLRMDTEVSLPHEPPPLLAHYEAPIRLRRSIGGNRLRAAASIRNHIANNRSPPLQPDSAYGPRLQEQQQQSQRNPYPTYAVLPAPPLGAAPVSTMVTTTKTDDLPSDSEVTVRMKTIRSRTETILLLEKDLEEAADEMKAIHVTPIVTRFPEQKSGEIKDQDGEEDDEEETEETRTVETTTKRRKGLGLKKARKEEAERRRKLAEATLSPPSRPTSEQTKSPRHLLSSRPTTPPPGNTTEHRSAYVHGAIDPKDPKFSNKGEIRAYPSQVASKRPKGAGRKKANKQKSNLSKDISALWTMNETQYDLYTSTARTPFHGDDEEEDLLPSTLAPLPSPSPSTSSVQKPPPSPPPPARASTIQTLTIPARSIITEELLPTTESPSTEVQRPDVVWDQMLHQAKSSEGVTERRRGKMTESPSLDLGSNESLEQQPKYPPVHSPPKSSYNSDGELSDRDPVIINHQANLGSATVVPRTRQNTVLHGMDRSRDEDILAGKMTAHEVDPLRNEQQRRQQEERRRQREEKEREEREREEAQPVIDFQTQLVSFSASTICIARNLFVIWCLCEVISSLPFLAGIIAGRRALFVPTIVADILLLVVGGIFSLTIIVFALVLFLFQGEMHPQTLFEWLVFAFLIAGGLAPFAGVFYLSLKAIDVLVDSRRCGTRFVDDFSDINNSGEQRLL